MASSIDPHLRNLSTFFHLKKDFVELIKINLLKDIILKDLDKELGDVMHRRFIFGSYDRDTILPHSIDSKAHIDILVVFDESEHEKTPKIYRGWLKDFAHKYYKNKHGSSIVQSSPKLTIKMDTIYFNLIPAKEENQSSSNSTLYIPTDYAWQKTDPNAACRQLIEADTKYDEIVKPIVRLMKAWNCANGYPYNPFKLELFTTSLNYYNDTIQSGFFYAISKLSTDWSDSQMTKDKVWELKENIDKVKRYLEENDIERAKLMIRDVLTSKKNSTV